MREVRRTTMSGSHEGGVWIARVYFFFCFWTQTHPLKKQVVDKSLNQNSEFYFISVLSMRGWITWMGVKSINTKSDRKDNVIIVYCKWNTLTRCENSVEEKCIKWNKTENPSIIKNIGLSIRGRVFFRTEQWKRKLRCKIY